MRITRRTLLAATGGSLAIAGCLGDSDDSPGDGNGDTPDGGMETDTPEENGMAASVQVDSHPDFGDILVDGDGLTLYMFDADEQGSGTSACYDDCEDAWPPLSGEAAGGDGVTAELSTFEREDGTTQVAADGWPLYYFASDASPGDVNGQGVNDVWWLVGPDGAKITEEESSGPAGGGPSY